MGAFLAHSTTCHTVISTPYEKSILFGRDRELAQLDIACRDPHTPLLLLVAPVGTGKTALIHHWLEQCESVGWQGLDAVLGWSFSNEVNDDASQTALCEFLEYALAWFGSAFTADQTCIEKAGLLVKQLQQQRVLLILDHPPSAILKAEFDVSEPAACLYTLLKPLAINNPGFCLLALDDVDVGYVGTLAGHCLKLGNLGQTEGVKLLMHQGVPGGGKALGNVSALFDHHPLTLALLGHYLKDACAGDLEKLDTIPIWLDSQANGRHTRRVLAAYEGWLVNTPELALMYVLSLFDRPASPDRVLDLYHRVFRRRFFFIHQQIPSILLPLGRLNSNKLLHLQQRLSDLHVLTPYANAEMLEMHSVIREYFAQKFRLTFMRQWMYLRKVLAADREESYALPTSILPKPKLETETIENEPINVTDDMLMEAIAVKNWRQAADLALQRYEQTLIQGDMTVSIHYVRQSVAYAHLAGEELHLQQNLALLTELLQKTTTTTTTPAAEMEAALV